MPLLVSMLAFAGSGAASAQAAGHVSHALTIAVVDRLHDPNSVASLQRTPGADGRDVLVIQRSAVRPQVLVAAAVLFRASLTRHGDRPGAPVWAFIAASRKHFPPMLSTDSAWATEVIAKLSQAKADVVPGYGSQPAITIDVSR